MKYAYVANIKRNGFVSLSNEVDENAGMSIIVRDSTDQEVSKMVEGFTELTKSKSAKNSAVAAGINQFLTAAGFSTINETQIFDWLRPKQKQEI